MKILLAWRTTCQRIKSLLSWLTDKNNWRRQIQSSVSQFARLKEKSKNIISKVVLMLARALKHRERHFLAVEFTSHSVKLVKMTDDGTRQKITEAKSVVLSASSDDPQVRCVYWKKAARALLSREKRIGRVAYLCVSNPATYLSSLVIRKISFRKLRRLFQTKNRENVSFPIEKAAMDYRLFELPGSRKYRYLLALAAFYPKNFLNGARKILKSEGFMNISRESVFCVSALHHSLSIATRNLIAIVDVGHSMTEIALYARGRLCLLKKIPFGGRSLSQALTQPAATPKGTHAALSYEEAERAKVRENLFDMKNRHLVAGKIEAFKLVSLARPEFDTFVRELRSLFDLYTQQHGEGIERIYLTGGGSRLKGFLRYVEETFEVPTRKIAWSDDLSIASHLNNEALDSYGRLIGLLLDRREEKIDRWIFIGRKLISYLKFKAWWQTFRAPSVSNPY